MLSKKYDLIYSLGADCLCAMYMVNHNLRICSGVFDWLCNASLKTRIDLINEDFNGFLNIEDLVPYIKRGKDELFDYYENKRNNFAYLHDFYNNISLDAAFGDVKEKYDRRIKRFYQNIEENKNILLIWNDIDDVYDEFEIQEMHHKLELKFGKNVDLLIICNRTGNQEFLETQINNSIFKFVLCDKSEVNKNKDKLNYIFQSIKFKHKNKIIINSILAKFLIKSLTFLIPIKKTRKRIKNKLRKYIKDEPFSI